MLGKDVVIPEEVKAHHYIISFAPEDNITMQEAMDFGRVYETKTGQKYSKGDELMYGKLCKAGDEEKAIQIAQQKLEQCKREGKTKPSEMCPCTTVHELVGEIKGKIN